jgi:hypothetical protein
LKTLILSGSNHGFAESAQIIHDFLAAQADLAVTLTGDKTALTSPDLNNFDVLIFGTGFTKAVRQPDGSLKREAELTPAQEDGLFGFVRGGKGLVGIHGTAWWVGGRAVDLIGGAIPTGIHQAKLSLSTSKIRTIPLCRVSVILRSRMKFIFRLMNRHCTSWPRLSGITGPIPWPG